MTLIDKLISMGYENKKATSMIMAGEVLVNEEVAIIGSLKIKNDDVIRIKEVKQWVSRGAYKLLEAIKIFNIDVNNKYCLDIGASTGGFTQVLLKNGAKKIYSLDSGTNQLDYSLRINEKVVALEKTNLKEISINLFNELINLVVCDVSFISIKNVFDVLANENVLTKDNDLIILIKPQFEAKREDVEKGGFVNINKHQEIIENIIKYAQNKGFVFKNVVESPILGNKSKNVEYLSWFKKEVRNE